MCRASTSVRTHPTWEGGGGGWSPAAIRSAGRGIALHMTEVAGRATSVRDAFAARGPPLSADSVALHGPRPRTSEEPCRCARPSSATRPDVHRRRSAGSGTSTGLHEPGGDHYAPDHATIETKASPGACRALGGTRISSRRSGRHDLVNTVRATGRGGLAASSPALDRRFGTTRSRESRCAGEGRTGVELHTRVRAGILNHTGPTEPGR